MSSGAKADASVELTLNGLGLQEGVYAQALELRDNYRFVEMCAISALLFRSSGTSST